MLEPVLDLSNGLFPRNVILASEKQSSVSVTLRHLLDVLHAIPFQLLGKHIDAQPVHVLENFLGILRRAYFDQGVRLFP